MTDKDFSAANRGLPCPDGCPPAPYRIMRITYAAYRAGLLNAATGAIIRAFVERWDELTDSEKNSLRTFANAFETIQE